MPEPVATPVCSTAMIMSGITCSVFGLDFEALFWGFLGGLIAQSFIPGPPKPPIGAEIEFSLHASRQWIRMIIRSAIPLIAGAVLAAVLTPFGMNIILGMGLGTGIGANALKIAAATVLGIIAPVIPSLLRKKSEGA